MTSPKDYQIFQRDGSNQANIIISGTTAYSDSVEARWGSSGSWTTLRTAGGTFLDTLFNQSAGQKTLYVRGKHTIDATDSAQYVGVGDNFVIAGQSNAVGQSPLYQTWTHPTLKAGLFGNDYQWHILTDPTDINTNQVDAVSNDGDGNSKGSIWPIIADSIMANYGIPVGLIPCAAGGTRIEEWIPYADHFNRATKYGSMATRADSVGAKAVLWWQGEYEAVLGDRAAYNPRLDSLANSANRDFGCKVMPVLLQDLTDIATVYEDSIRTAVTQAWTDNPNVLVGPDFSDIQTDDTRHILTQAKIDSCANRFWRKIRDNIYEAP